ncbi:YciI family protein [Robbsia sp. KACC 23696]|uniref:YciI family protein n=1 Tax=Robbsia sp. KACC 23696 TaxID=3149231 RepID=UPI00325AFFBD
MKFVNNARYIKDTDKINSVRPAHREYLAKIFAEGKLLLAGPYVDGSGATIVYEADSIDAAHELAKGDPFFYEGVFEHYELKEWKAVFVSKAIEAQ